MDIDKKYTEISEKYPCLSTVIRDSFLSSVTNSEDRKKDKKNATFALKKFHKKRKKVAIDLYKQIYTETKDFVDIIPSIVKFFDNISK